MTGPDQPNDRRRDDTSQGAQIRTFLIADVRGYTLFTQERGDEAAAKLAAKFADIAREGVEARGGTLLELRGDEALCVFASDAGGDPRRRRPPAAVRRGDARAAGAAAHGRHRARRRRGGPRPGRLPGRRAEPGRSALRPGSRRRDPRIAGGHAPRADGRRRPVRGSRDPDPQGHSRTPSRSSASCPRATIPSSDCDPSRRLLPRRGRPRGAGRSPSGSPSSWRSSRSRSPCSDPAMTPWTSGRTRSRA